MISNTHQRSLAAMLGKRSAIAIAVMVLVGSGFTAAMVEVSARSQMRETGRIVTDQAVAQVISQFDRPTVTGRLASA